MSNWRDFGSFEAKAFVASRFKMDGGSMFGQVPKVLWSKYAKADEQNRIDLVLRLVLIRTSGALVLLDAGMGTVYSEKQQRITGIDMSLGDLPTRLRAEGIEPTEVTHVVISHLHFDHVGGLLTGSEGALEPALPRAKVLLQRKQWEKAHNPGLKEKDSFRQTDIEFLERLDLELLEGEVEVLPGLWIFPSDGHTAGLQAVRMEGTQGALYFPSDLIPTMAHIRAPYTMGFDQWPEKIVEEKMRFLGMAASRGAVVVFEHDPANPACIVGEGERGFVVREKVSI